MKKLVDKIKLDLFLLKSKEDLISVHRFFLKNIKIWFHNDGSPKEDFFVYRSCPLCGAGDSNEEYVIDNFSYHRCFSCDSIYTKPHLKDGVLDSLYQDGAYQVYQDSLVKKGSKLRKGFTEKRKFEQIKSLLAQEEVSILDVGCGGGTFLEICYENGWNVYGAEPSSDAQSKKHLNIRQGDFNKMDFDRKFDVVSFWGVLEHMSDPILALSKSQELLQDNGIIVFEVPSANCFLSEYLKRSTFSPTRYIESGRHNIFFSMNLIRKVAAENNLEILVVESNGLDIQTILLEEFKSEITDKILDIQDTINELLLGDHYRVFLRKSVN